MNPDSSDPSQSGDALPLQDFEPHRPPADLDYELVRLIGRGGYGEVWLVRDQSGKHFACKAVYRASFREARPYEREFEGIQKFEPVSRANESQVKILHVGRRDDAGYFYYLMELADDIRSGSNINPESYVPKTLRTEIEQRGRLPVSQCVQIGLSLSAALDNLHRNGLIHRDVKPANIIFVQDTPKLADIGLVADIDVTVSYVGTEGFIPPEGPRSAQADVYALGKVLYEIATGKDRLQFPELPDNFGDFPDWDLLRELNAVILKACEIDPAKRYASAREFHDDLALLSTGKSVRRAHAARRRTGLILRGCAALVLAVALGTGLFYLYTLLVQRAETTVAGTKAPWPTAHDIALNEAKLKDDYRRQLDSGAPPVRQQAALELMKRSASSGDPAFAAASLRVAGLLAADAEDISLTLEICGKMTERFDVDIFPEEADLLTEAARHARSPRNKTDLAEACIRSGFAAIAADEYASAAKIANLARESEPEANDQSLAPEVAFLDQQTLLCSQAFEQIAEQWKTFREKPNDARAALAVGKFLCFVKDDWSGGLPLLLRGNDNGLKAVATTEINDQLTKPQERTLGDSWWDLSAKAAEAEKIFYQRRARYWYLKSLTGIGPRASEQLRRELADRINAVETEPGTIHLVSRVGGAEFIDIYSDEVDWRNNRRDTSDNKINHVSLGDLKPGEVEVVKNCGATWLMPDCVDFSTAQLVTNRISNLQGGQATLRTFDDHVRVILAHPRFGESQMDVTVAFGKQS